jgi:uncharacterized protein
MIAIRTFRRGDEVSAFPDRLQALLSPRAYPHAVQSVELIETHVSWVLLTGEFAYKIKRPVRHSFVDQRSLQRRRWLCQEELRLNRRFAPELYLGVSPIAGRAGAAQVEGSGRIIEYAVKMHQFPQSDELDHLLEAGRIEPNELEAFAGELARIHARLPSAPPAADSTQPDTLTRLIQHNLEECAQAGKPLGGIRELAALQRALQALVDSTTALRAQRRAEGRVHECHGDLHTRNLVRYGGRLLAFDGLEFDAALRWIDVADEISFLLADLAAREYPRHAQAFLGGYLTESGDYQACVLLPLFKAHRALVRAKITALTARHAATGAADLDTARRQYAAYVEGARQSVTPLRPILVLMCGLSGSGKTWLAKRLAPELGAVHLRSDLERKRLAGLSALDRSASPVGQGLYSSAASLAVYQRLSECAADTLRGGYTTIVDASFGRAENRAPFRELARRAGVNSCVIYCRAPRQVLEARLLERQRRNNDASEADRAVLDWQAERFEPPEAHEASAVLEAESAERAIGGLVTALDTLRT